MLNKIIAFSIKNKLIIGLMTLALIIWGGWSATKLPIDAVPDITNNQVQIITVCPTLAGQEVEKLITYPVEQSIANLPNLEELRSISRFGLSVITVVFDEDVDVYFARQLITERLKEAESNIPKGLGTPELAPVSTGLGEVYQYIIHPKKGSESKYNSMDLRTMQDWIVARQLYGTPGIAEVNSFGGNLKQYEVSVNPNRLLAMDVTIPEIYTTLEMNNENTGGAYIDKKPNAFFIRGLGLIGSFSDIENMVVKLNPNGIPILIKDVASVGYGSAVRYGATSLDGETEVVGGVVMMLKGYNSAEVVNSVKEKMISIQKALPDDIVIEPFLDRTDLINRAISTVERNLIEGALIVIFVLVLFLGNLRAGLIVASAIPLSMLFALGLMHLFGVSANLMSLGAIDFGLIVDGAVIIVEATMHHLGLRKSSSRLSQHEMDNEVYVSASKIRSSAAFGEIIILIVYIPILALIGIEGKMFRPMAQTVAFAILGALVLSLTYIPMMCALFLSKNNQHQENFSDKMMHWFKNRYQPILEKAITLRHTIVTFTVLLFAGTIVIFSNMGGEFIPTLQEGDFAFHCILPQGTSLSQSMETSKQAARLIKKFDEVKMVVGKTGSAEVPTDPMPPEATDMMIILKPQKEWKRDVSYNELADEIMHKIENIPGAFFESNQPIQMRFNELMTGVRQDVAIKIFGENMDTLLKYGDYVAQIVQKIEGVSATQLERVDGLPQIVIHYNRNQMANYGLNISEVNHLISAAFAGGKAGVVFENERKFDLVVRLDSQHRKDLSNVEHLFVPTPSGLQIPLSQIADVKMELGPAQISREDGKRRIVVGFNVINRDVESVVTDIESSLEERLDLPESYYITYGGTFENLQAASKRLMIALPIALGLIFLLLFFTFNSIKQAGLIFSAIPMAAIGGVFALILRNMPFSISAGVGFIALFGVAVLNGIVLIGTFNQLKKDGISDVIERVRIGTSVRLRPVLMTATVASLGFLPMALSNGAGAEVQKPLATVVIGGLLSATLLTLFVLPILYIMFTKKIKTKSNAGFKALTIFLLCTFFTSSNAQNTAIYGLQEVITISIKNNLEVQASTDKIKSSEIVENSKFVLPKTSVNFQFGQYNSIENDRAFQVSQTFAFPSYYSAKSDLLQAQTQSSKIAKRITENEIRANAKALFYQLNYLVEERAQLRRMDTLYAELVNISTLKHTSGETNFLELTSAKMLYGEVGLALRKNQDSYEMLINQLKQLMNVDHDFQLRFSQDFQPAHLIIDLDSNKVNNNPILAQIIQQSRVLEASKKLESNSLLPEISIGYFNQTMVGNQTVNGAEVYFDRSKKFQGINLGVSIPLTYFAGKSKVKALQIDQEANDKLAKNQALFLQTTFENLLIEYNHQLETYLHYNQDAVWHAETLIQTAQLAYNQGEIEYFEYIRAIQSAQEIYIKYYQSINQLNQTLVQVELLTNI